MIYFAHGLALALTWFLGSTAFFSVIAAVAASWLMSSPERRAVPGPDAWFVLRIGPSIGAFIFVALVFMPSYWLFEPRDAAEAFDVTLWLGALSALVILVFAAARGFIASRAVGQRARDWLRTARPLNTFTTTVPTLVVETPTPVMALVGIARPRVFVSARLVAALTAEELSATIEHEAAHWRAADNLKRLAIRMAPDVLGGTAVAHAIERRWATAVEQAADDRGTRGDVTRRCTLASALVKVARLMPQPVPPLEPISTFVGGGDLASRIERLLDDPPRREPRRPHRWAIAATLAVGSLLVAYGPLLRAIHEATEVLVNRLP